MKFLSVILMSLMLVSCATQPVQESADSEKYQDVLNLWLKKEKKDLISVWGNPSYDYQKEILTHLGLVSHLL